MTVATNGNGIADLLDGTSISNTNAVAYSGFERPGADPFIAVKDVGVDPVVVVKQNDLLGPGGPVMNLQPNNFGGYISKNASNAKGELAFRALVDGAFAIVRATPDPGVYRRIQSFQNRAKSTMDSDLGVVG